MAPRIRGRTRCRMHGGANGSGAPIGNCNALKHGTYTARERERYKRWRQALKSLRAGLEDLS